MEELGVGVLEKEGFLSKLRSMGGQGQTYGGVERTGGPPVRGRLGSDREKDVPSKCSSSCVGGSCEAVNLSAELKFKLAINGQLAGKIALAFKAVMLPFSIRGFSFLP